MLLLPVLAVFVGCGEDVPPHPQAEKVLETLEALASEPVRREVLRTCDKWKRPDGTCDESAVRYDQFDCWMTKGLRKLQGLQKRKIRPRARDRGTMRAQNLCMELRGWGFVKPSGYF